MADSIDVVVTIGSDTGVRFDLDEHLTAEIPGEDSQHLDRIAGGDYNPRHLRGSGQAGTVRVYAGLIRRGNAHNVLEYLARAPWGYRQGVVVIEDSLHDGPWVWLVNRDGSTVLRQPELRF